MLNSCQCPDGIAEGYEVGIAQSKIDSSLSPFLLIGHAAGHFIGKFEDESYPVFETRPFIGSDSPTFRRQIIYNGRVDNNLKFIYREFSNNLARGPFTQEIQYDINESLIIGFKGVRIEVIEATNTKIKYKVLRNFGIFNN